MEILGPNAVWIVGLAVFVGTAIAAWWRHVRSPDGKAKKVLNDEIQKDIDRIKKDLRAAHSQLEFLTLENHVILGRVQNLERNGKK